MLLFRGWQKSCLVRTAKSWRTFLLVGRWDDSSNGDPFEVPLEVCWSSRVAFFCGLRTPVSRLKKSLGVSGSSSESKGILQEWASKAVVLLRNTQAKQPMTAHGGAQRPSQKAYRHKVEMLTPTQLLVGSILQQYMVGCHSGAVDNWHALHWLLHTLSLSPAHDLKACRVSTLWLKVLKGSGTSGRSEQGVEKNAMEIVWDTRPALYSKFFVCVCGKSIWWLEMCDRSVATQQLCGALQIR